MFGALRPSASSSWIGEQSGPPDYMRVKDAQAGPLPRAVERSKAGQPPAFRS